MSSKLNYGLVVAFALIDESNCFQTFRRLFTFLSALTQRP